MIILVLSNKNATMNNSATSNSSCTSRSPWAPSRCPLISVAFPNKCHLSVAFCKGLSLVQWIYIIIVQWIVSDMFQWNFMFVISGVLSFAVTAGVAKFSSLCLVYCCLLFVYTLCVYVELLHGVGLLGLGRLEVSLRVIMIIITQRNDNTLHVYVCVYIYMYI